MCIVITWICIRNTAEADHEGGQMQDQYSLTEQMHQFVISSNNTHHYYMYTCMMEQKLSDARLLNLSNIFMVDSNTELWSLRKAAVQLAKKLIDKDRSTGHDRKFLQNSESMLNRMSVNKSDPNDILRILSEIRTPECSGYDLCDVEICYDDAKKWLYEMSDMQSPPLLIGIRTGGGYFAPFWSLACQHKWDIEVPYYTVRALRAHQTIHFLDEELAMLPHKLSEKTIVIIDDQPHTGETVKSLAQRLLHLYGDSVSIWMMSPGRIFKLNGLRLEKLTERLPIVNQPLRLWEVLDHDEAVITKISEVPEMSSLLTGNLIVVPHNQQLKHWCHPSLQESFPLRINPKKSPFTIRRKSDGKIILFARFIGKDLFGEFQYNQLSYFDKWMPSKTAYKDGYLLTEFMDQLTDLRGYAVKETELTKLAIADQSSEYWERLLKCYSVSLFPSFNGESEKLWCDIEKIEQRLKSTLPIDRSWFQESIKLLGEHRNLIYSSLPYSHEHWHWKYKKNQYGQPKVYRFHIESTWGGISSIELEIASFILANRLDRSWVKNLIKMISTRLSGISEQSIVQALPMAFMLNIRSMMKQKKWPDPDSIISSDLTFQLQWMNDIKRLY